MAAVPVEQGTKRKHFVLCNDLRSLIWLVNFGCIDMNPWASRVGSIDRLDYLVIDLDPSGVPFDRVVEVAQEVHRVLDRIGAANYAKTSGKSGMHVFVPLGAKYDAWQVKALGEVVAILVHPRMPELTTRDHGLIAARAGSTSTTRGPGEGKPWRQPTPSVRQRERPSPRR
ncbi:hypothetical protein AYO40_03130 [Planctomycetaceae bacterium SCGC AG-212-D15]|nr:hypothetical protein AYO40_03130 [Planctomycetaceae bacterium SCGC AG-212-D15]